MTQRKKFGTTAKIKKNQKPITIPAIKLFPAEGPVGAKAEGIVDTIVRAAIKHLQELQKNIARNKAARGDEESCTAQEWADGVLHLARVDMTRLVKPQTADGRLFYKIDFVDDAAVLRQMTSQIQPYASEDIIQDMQALVLGEKSGKEIQTYLRRLLNTITNNSAWQIYWSKLKSQLERPTDIDQLYPIVLSALLYKIIGECAKPLTNALTTKLKDNKDWTEEKIFLAVDRITAQAKTLLGQGSTLKPIAIEVPVESMEPAFSRQKPAAGVPVPVTNCLLQLIVGEVGVEEILLLRAIDQQSGETIATIDLLQNGGEERELSIDPRMKRTITFPQTLYLANPFGEEDKHALAKALRAFEQDGGDALRQEIIQVRDKGVELIHQSPIPSIPQLHTLEGAPVQQQAPKQRLHPALSAPLEAQDKEIEIMLPGEEKASRYRVDNPAYQDVLSDHLPIINKFTLDDNSSIKLLSWNVLERDGSHGCAIDAGVIDACGETPAQEKERHQGIAEALTKMVAQQDPDVLTLQEISFSDDEKSLFRLIWQGLGENWAYMADKDKNITFYRKDRFTLEHEMPDHFKKAFKTRYQETCQGLSRSEKTRAEKHYNEALERVSLPLSIRLIRTGDKKRVAVHNFHANFQRSPVLHELLIKSILGSNSSPNVPVTNVVAGDFNCTAIPQTDMALCGTAAQGAKVNQHQQGIMCIEGCYHQQVGGPQQAASRPKQAGSYTLDPKTGEIFNNQTLLDHVHAVLYDPNATEERAQLRRLNNGMHIEEDAYTQAMQDYEDQLKQRLGPNIVVRSTVNGLNQRGVGIEVPKNIFDALRCAEKLFPIQFLDDGERNGYYQISCEEQYVPQLNELIRKYFRSLGHTEDIPVLTLPARRPNIDGEYNARLNVDADLVQTVTLGNNCKVGVCEIVGGVDNQRQEDRLICSNTVGVQGLSSLDDESIERAYYNTFEQLQKEHGNYQSVGTTCCSATAWMSKGQGNKPDQLTVWTANLGDSAAYLVVTGEDEFGQRYQKTRRLTSPTQADPNAVTAEGPKMKGLAVHGSFGDKNAEKDGLTHRPNVEKHTLSLRPKESAYLILGCDGLEESHTLVPDDLGRIVDQNRHRQPGEIAAAMVNAAYNEGKQGPTCELILMPDPTLMPGTTVSTRERKESVGGQLLLPEESQDSSVQAEEATPLAIEAEAQGPAQVMGPGYEPSDATHLRLYRQQGRGEGAKNRFFFYYPEKTDEGTQNTLCYIDELEQNYPEVLGGIKLNLLNAYWRGLSNAYKGITQPTSKPGAAMNILGLTAAAGYTYRHLPEPLGSRDNISVGIVRIDKPKPIARIDKPEPVSISVFDGHGTQVNNDGTVYRGDHVSNETSKVFYSTLDTHIIEEQLADERLFAKEEEEEGVEMGPMPPPAPPPSSRPGTAESGSVVEDTLLAPQPEGENPLPVPVLGEVQAAGPQGPRTSKWASITNHFRTALTSGELNLGAGSFADKSRQTILNTLTYLNTPVAEGHIPPKQDREKIKIFADCVVAEYRKLLRSSKYNNPGLFRGSSPQVNSLVHALKTSCKQDLFFTLPDTLKKGEALSLEGEGLPPIKVGNRYYHMLEGIKPTSKPSPEEQAQLFDLLSDVINMDEWRHQTSLRSQPEGIEKMQYALRRAGNYELDTLQRPQSVDDMQVGKIYLDEDANGKVRYSLKVRDQTTNTFQAVGGELPFTLPKGRCDVTLIKYPGIKDQGAGIEIKGAEKNHLYLYQREDGSLFYLRPKPIGQEIPVPASKELQKMVQGLLTNAQPGEERPCKDMAICEAVLGFTASKGDTLPMQTAESLNVIKQDILDAVAKDGYIRGKEYVVGEMKRTCSKKLKEDTWGRRPATEACYKAINALDMNSSYSVRETTKRLKEIKQALKEHRADYVYDRQH